MKFTTLVLASFSFTAHAQLVDDLDFSWNQVSLPFPVSDIMANYMQGDNGDDDGFIIITGGCDSPKGNERANFGDGDLFVCLSTSNRTLLFDPFRNEFQEMAAMPHQRQRHAAAVAHGELYLLGGRDTDDALVTAIDAFNPKTNTWTTRGQLPDDIVTSDLTAWSWNNFIYVTGGFTNNYTAVGNTYRLDVSQNPMSFDAMQYTPLQSSPNPRGDIQAVQLFGYAYLAGGVNSDSFWCDPIETTERYHMETDSWQEIAPLQVGRADMAMAVLNNKIVSIGGETKPDDCVNVQDPAYGSFPQDVVEVLLNPESNGGKAEWIAYEKFDDKRFRFAAAAVPALGKLYTFGGQLPHDFTCDCFPTSDKVGVAVEVFKEKETMHPGAIAAIVLGALLGVLILGFLLRMASRRDSNIDPEFVETPATES